MKIILHSDDINLLTYWESFLVEEFSVCDEIDSLKEFSESIIMMNYSSFDGTQKELIQTLSESGNLVFVLDRTPDMQKAKSMLSYGAKAYGNALMKAHFILSAIDTIKDQMIWLHPEFVSQLITQIQPKESDISHLLDKLSARESEVALLIRDGDTYKNIAKKLEITPRTIKAHTQHIYAKLDVKDRLALALLLK